MYYIYNVESNEIISNSYNTEKEAIYDFTAQGLNAWFFNIKKVD